MKRWLERGLAATLGLLVLLAGVELALRVAGWRAMRALELPQQADLAVLCVGDSFTYGLGAPRGRSYPDQLEARLSEQLPGRSVAVVNRGILSASSNVVLGELERSLPAARWDAVVVLAGGTNTLRPPGRGGSSEPPPPLPGEALGGRPSLRLLRLLPGLRDDLRGEQLRRMAQEGDLGQGFDTAARSLRSPPGAPEPAPCAAQAEGWCARGAWLQAQGWAGLARRAYERAAQAQPDCAGAYRGLLHAAISLRDAPALRDAAERWAHHRPADPDASGLLLSLLLDSGELAEAELLLADRAADGSASFTDLRWRAELATRRGEVDRAEDAWRALSTDANQVCDAHLGLVRVALVRGERALAEERFDALLAQPDRDCDRPGMLLSAACGLDRAERARELLGELLARDPRSWSGLLYAAAACTRAEDLPAIRGLLEAHGIRGSHLDEVVQGVGVGRRLYDPTLEVNLEEIGAMQELADGADVPLLVLTYPYPSAINAGIRELAVSRGIQVVDVEVAMQARLVAGEPRDRYFVGDGDDPILGNDHCSAQGYGLMADQVLLGLREAGVIP
jgi:tetratricopeptide (TPR) repeat protein